MQQTAPTPDDTDLTLALAGCGRGTEADGATLDAVEATAFLEGWIDARVRERSVALLERAGLPVAPPAEMTGAQFLDAMAVDKKAIAGSIRLVLLDALGKARVSADYDPEKLRQVLPD